MTSAQIIATRLELSRAMRDSTDVGDVVAMRLLDRLALDPVTASPLDGECSCGRLLGVGDHAWCEACARRRAHL